MIATIEDGRIVDLRGDRDGPLHNGYTCIKGREHRRFYDHPERLTQSLVRSAGDGMRAPIGTRDAIDAIADRLTRIVDTHGPRSVALFVGSYAFMDHPANLTMVDAFMRALGSPMYFSTPSIDQSGKPVARALHGIWMAPGRGALGPEAILLLGTNPLISHMTWAGNPGDFFKGIDERGASLIVIDPRRTETARRARIHLQARPGHDVELLAAMLKVIFEEGLEDQEFLTENVDGVDSLRAAVSGFDPAQVADRAGVGVDDLVAAARLFARARGAYAMAGTGPNMSGRSTLLEYLVLSLQTVCGHWSRAGDPIPNALTVIPDSMQMRQAQALPPFPGYGYGEPSRVRGLGQTGNGMPTATAAEEILLEGEGRVRALISLGGNPIGCWPDQERTVRALKSLDLLVQGDVMMSGTAQLADYVVSMRLPYELIGTTFLNDVLVGFADPFGKMKAHAQYTDPIVEAPPEAISHPEFLFRLAQRMGLSLEVYPGIGSSVPGGAPVALDMERDFDEQLVFDLVHQGSRIPIDVVKKYPSGALFPAPGLVVEPKQDGWEGRLDVGNDQMMTDLVTMLSDSENAEGYPFRLISRRMPHVFNGPNIATPQNRPPYNPAFMHPDDLRSVGLESGDAVEIRSRHGVIEAVAECDDSLLPGTVSISHAWGGAGDTEESKAIPGSPVGRLIDNTVEFDPYTGQPRMSNIPVAVTPLGVSSSLSGPARKE